jgi:hypothetical protein
MFVLDVQSNQGMPDNAQIFEAFFDSLATDSDYVGCVQSSEFSSLILPPMPFNSFIRPKISGELRSRLPRNSDLTGAIKFAHSQQKAYGRDGKETLFILLTNGKKQDAALTPLVNSAKLITVYIGSNVDEGLRKSLGKISPLNFDVSSFDDLQKAVAESFAAINPKAKDVSNALTKIDDNELTFPPPNFLKKIDIITVISSHPRGTQDYSIELRNKNQTVMLDGYDPSENSIEIESTKIEYFPSEGFSVIRIINPGRKAWTAVFPQGYEVNLCSVFETTRFDGKNVAILSVFALVILGIIIFCLYNLFRPAVLLTFSWCNNNGNDVKEIFKISRCGKKTAAKKFPSNTSFYELLKNHAKPDNADDNSFLRMYRVVFKGGAWKFEYPKNNPDDKNEEQEMLSSIIPATMTKNILVETMAELKVVIKKL